MDGLSARTAIHLTTGRGAVGAPLNCPNTYQFQLAEIGAVLTTLQEKSQD